MAFGAFLSFFRAFLGFWSFFRAFLGLLGLSGPFLGLFLRLRPCSPSQISLVWGLFSRLREQTGCMSCLIRGVAEAVKSVWNSKGYGFLL